MNELEELAAAGIGEGDFDDDCAMVPAELTDIFIELEDQDMTHAEFKELFGEPAG